VFVEAGVVVVNNTHTKVRPASEAYSYTLSLPAIPRNYNSFVKNLLKADRSSNGTVHSALTVRHHGVMTGKVLVTLSCKHKRSN
jgi:hypothetical protein